MDGAGNPTGPAFPSTPTTQTTACLADSICKTNGKSPTRLTANYGARFDFFNSSFDHENQVSPRANLIYNPTDSTTLHAGYARYFTPPPVENTSAATVNQFDGTSNASSITNGISGQPAASAPIILTRASRKKSPSICKSAWTAITNMPRNSSTTDCSGRRSSCQPFNYSRGRDLRRGIHQPPTRTADFPPTPTSPTRWRRAKTGVRRNILFDPTDLAYVKNHWIYLDHDQELTGSFGTSYLWKESDRTSTLVYLDALYGSGLRTDETTSSGQVIPNGGTVSPYYSINCGVEQSFQAREETNAEGPVRHCERHGQSYELRDGSGVGVNAASYRRAHRVLRFVDLCVLKFLR